MFIIGNQLKNKNEHMHNFRKNQEAGAGLPILTGRVEFDGGYESN